MGLPFLRFGRTLVILKKWGVDRVNETKWAAVDAFLESGLHPAGDPVLETVLEANAAAGLPRIDVSALEGAFLGLVVRMSGARRVLEIGTLGGYSAICMARCLPEDGRLISLEVVPEHADLARANVARAGLSRRVEVRTGAALDLLSDAAEQADGPFDLVFIDADKRNNPAYLDWAVRLSRPGTVIIVDNVVRGGAVIETDSGDSSVEGARAAIDFLGRNPRISATAIQTVGSKGYDGFALGIVT